MPDASAPSLLPVIIGGLLAIAGGAVTTLTTVILHFMRTKTEKKNKRSEKYEELVAAVFEHEHWLNQKMRMRVYGEEGEETVSPMTAYFPQLLPKIRMLGTAASTYENWMLEAAQMRQDGKDDYKTILSTTYREYRKVVNELLNDLKEYATREFH
jgi:hypothetical protein